MLGGGLKCTRCQMCKRNPAEFCGVCAAEDLRRECECLNCNGTPRFCNKCTFDSLKKAAVSNPVQKQRQKCLQCYGVSKGLLPLAVDYCLHCQRIIDEEGGEARGEQSTRTVLGCPELMNLMYVKTKADGLEGKFRKIWISPLKKTKPTIDVSKLPQEQTGQPALKASKRLLRLMKPQETVTQMMWRQWVFGGRSSKSSKEEEERCNHIWNDMQLLATLYGHQVLELTAEEIVS